MTAPAPRQIRRLFPGPGTTTPAEAAQELGLGERPHDDRPWVTANMASTADGRGALGGLSGGIGNEADRLLFAANRTQVDAVLVGTGTLAAERYGSIITDRSVRKARELAGLTPQPLACVLTRSGHVPWDIPLFDDPDQVVVLYTANRLPPQPVKAKLDVIVMADGDLTFTAALRDLHTRHGVGWVLCEGGPTVQGMLVAEGLLDELLLTFSPLLAGGGDAPRITMGPSEIDPPTRMELRRVLEDEGLLFLRYLITR